LNRSQSDNECEYSKKILQFYSPPISRYTTHSLSHVSVGSIFLVNLSFNQKKKKINPFSSFYVTVPKLVGIFSTWMQLCLGFRLEIHFFFFFEGRLEIHIINVVILDFLNIISFFNQSETKLC